MEASRVSRLEVAFTMAFGIFDGDTPLARPRESSLIAELADSRDELERQLEVAIAESQLPFVMEIERVEIRPGSILVDIYAVLLGVGSTIGYYGQLRQGLNEIAHDLQAICERFLGRNTPGPVYALQAGWSLLPPGALPLPRAKSQRDPLLMYLLISHGVLMAALIGIVIVLLAQT